MVKPTGAKNRIENRNLTRTVEETYGRVWSVSEEWVYDWNPRDQMTSAMKWAGSSAGANNVGSVEYQYCLACDGALSKRFVYAGGSGASRGALQSGQRYEYDGLNLLRVDEIYGSILSESGPWRTLEISTHQPGQLAALLHKRVYEYSSATSGSPSQTKDFTYSYDPVGNVYSVFDGSGNEAYYFTQDAFGNELPTTTLGGDDWNAAMDDRIVEHQTGKWIDAFTGLYYFAARWYDSEVGRFVGRDVVYRNKNQSTGIATNAGCTHCSSVHTSTGPYYSPNHTYTLSLNNPVGVVDPTGLFPWWQFCSCGWCFATHGAWMLGCASGCGSDIDCITDCWWESAKSSPAEAASGAAACTLCASNFKVQGPHWPGGNWHIHVGPPPFQARMWAKWGWENLFHGRWHIRLPWK